MAKKQQTSPYAPPKSDAYTGLLIVSLLALMAGSAFLYLDWSQYSTSKPPLPGGTASRPAAGAAGAQGAAGVQGAAGAQGVQGGQAAGAPAAFSRSHAPRGVQGSGRGLKWAVGWSWR